MTAIGRSLRVINASVCAGMRFANVLWMHCVVVMHVALGDRISLRLSKLLRTMSVSWKGKIQV